MGKASRCLKSLGLFVTSCRKDNQRDQHADDVADHAREETAASRVEAGASVVVVQEHEQHANAIVPEAETETIAATDLTPPMRASETTERSGTGDDAKAAAAIKVQTAFRSYLARKALCMLRGTVKLQALVRGQLVRRQRDERLRLLDSDGRPVQDGSSSTSPQRHQQSRHNMAESSCHSRALIVSRQQRNPASESEVVMKEEELPSARARVAGARHEAGLLLLRLLVEELQDDNSSGEAHGASVVRAAPQHLQRRAHLRKAAPSCTQVRGRGLAAVPVLWRATQEGALAGSAS